MRRDLLGGTGRSRPWRCVQCRGGLRHSSTPPSGAPRPRSSTALGADLILAVEDGRIVEQGTHAEILAHDGLYTRLYTEQFASGKIEARCADGVRFRDGHAVLTGATRRLMCRCSGLQVKSRSVVYRGLTRDLCCC